MREALDNIFAANSTRFDGAVLYSANRNHIEVSDSTISPSWQTYQIGDLTDACAKYLPELTVTMSGGPTAHDFAQQEIMYSLDFPVSLTYETGDCVAAWGTPAGHVTMAARLSALRRADRSSPGDIFEVPERVYPGHGKVLMLSGNVPREVAIQALAQRVASVQFSATPFAQCIDRLQREQGLALSVQYNTLGDERCEELRRTPITLNEANEKVQVLLEKMIKQTRMDLIARPGDGVIIICPRSAFVPRAGDLPTRIYNVRDLVAPHRLSVLPGISVDEAPPPSFVMGLMIMTGTPEEHFKIETLLRNLRHQWVKDLK